MKNNILKLLTVFLALSFVLNVSAKSNSNFFEGERLERLKYLSKEYEEGLSQTLYASREPVDKSSHVMVLLKEDLNVEKMLAKIDFEYINFIASNQGLLFEVSLNDFNKIKKYYSNFILTYESLVVRDSLDLPNDPYASEQWGHLETKFYNVWDLLSSDSEVLTCVIDSGINRRHPDLQAVDLRVGYNYSTRNDVSNDYGGHGTNVSAIISATTNNNIGIVGLSQSSIIPLQVKYNQNDIYTSDIIAALYDAADIGCDVINLSLGSSNYSSLEKSAIDYAISKGALVVAAAGNDGYPTYVYPASYNNVISVGSINSSLLKSDFSNYNDEVTLVAPGEMIITANNRFGYDRVSGTSFAAPYVSAAGAIVKSFDKNVTQQDFIEILKNTSLDLGVRGYDNYYGYGLLDLENIVKNYLEIPPLIIEGASLGWLFDSESGAYYFINNNGQAHTGWLKDGGRWYYLNQESGIRESGWVLVNGGWYYFDNEGIMQTGWIYAKGYWYYLNNSGLMQTGWIRDGKNAYYLSSSGAMQTGWTKVSKNWYYLRSSGAMEVGWIKPGKVWYYLADSGAMEVGWSIINDQVYHFKNNGAMQVGWFKLDNSWYYSNAKGHLQSGWLKDGQYWYYLEPSGEMVIGYKRVNNKLYYFDNKGRMQ